MNDLVTFIRARLDEDEHLASGATPAPWTAKVGEGWRASDGRAHTLVGRIAVDVPGRQKWLYSGNEHGGTALHIANWDPARVQAEVDAKRRILDLHPCAGGDVNEPFCLTCTPDEALYGESLAGRWPCPTLRLLALPFSDHPSYREEWRP